MQDMTPADVEKTLLAIVREFLSEFKAERAIQQLTLNASLDRDLGIDSLGKVELFLRIEKAFSVKFDDALMIEANSLQDIALAIQTRNTEEKPRLATFTTPLEAPIRETKADPLSSKTLVEVLLRRSAEDPNRPHIYLQDERGSEEIIRYGQLLKTATHVAAGLRAQKLKPGETVAIMLPTCAQFFYAFFGVLLAGGIPVPIYPPLRADRIEEYAVREASILNNAEVRILITFDKIETLAKLLRVFIKSLNTVTTVQLLLENSGQVPSLTLQPYDPALIQYTSGSTSDPKGVLLSHHNLLSNIRAFGKAMHLSSTDVGISWLPLYHDMGLIGAWLGSLYHAFPLTVLSPISFINRPERWLWAIHYHRGTVSAGPNFAYELCVRKIEAAAIQGLDLSSWRLAFNGAEAVDPRTLERFVKKFAPYGFNPNALCPVYGLAESSVALTIPPLPHVPKTDVILREPFEKEHRAIPASNQDMQCLEFVSCGKPIPEHDIRIVDEQGHELGEREIGSLQFTGPSAMIGYYRNNQATEAIYQDGWWDSGDFAYLAEGNVYITGRKKDMIVKAGRNLYPQEIEAVAAEIRGVRKGSVIAFGVPDPKWGTEKLVIVAETLETKSSVRQQMISEIIEKISIVLAIPPDEVVLVPLRTIPKTSSGKLQRSLCKQLYLDGKLARRSLPVSMQMLKLFLKGIVISLIQNCKKIVRFFYTAYVAVLLLFFIPLIFATVVLLPRKFAAKIGRFLARLLLGLSIGPITVTGLEHTRSASPMIFIANHASYLDSLLLLSYLPSDVAFVGKKELQHWPIVSTILKKLDYLSVDRMDFSKSQTELEQMAQILGQGRSLVIFPEGTFTEALGLRPFKLGAFKLAVDTQIPLCPIALEGTRLFLRGNHVLLNWTPLKITCFEPLYPTSTEWSEVTRLHSEARAAIAKHCGELSIDFYPS